MNCTEQKRKKKGEGGWNSEEGPGDPQGADWEIRDDE